MTFAPQDLPLALLPPQLGVGSGHTASRRLRAWQAAGMWDRLHQLVLDELSDAELLD